MAGPLFEPFTAEYIGPRIGAPQEGEGFGKWLSDTGRAIGSSAVSAAASALGLGEMLSDDEWVTSVRKDLQQYAQDTVANMRPDRARAMQSEFIPTEGSGRQSFMDAPGQALWYKSLSAIGSTVPSAGVARIVGLLGGGPAGAVIAGASAEGLMSAGSVYSDLKDTLDKMSSEELYAKNDKYKRAIDFGLNDKEARGEALRDLSGWAVKAAVASTAMGGVGMGVGRGLAGRVLGKQVDEVGGTVGQRALATGFEETLQETGQQGGQMLAQHGGERALGQEGYTWQRGVNELAESALGGFTVGGAFGAAFGRRPVVTPGNTPSPAQELALGTTTATPPPPAPQPGWEDVGVPPAAPYGGGGVGPAMGEPVTAPPAPTPAPGYGGVPGLGELQTPFQEGGAPGYAPGGGEPLVGTNPPAVGTEGPIQQQLAQAAAAIAQLPNEVRTQIDAALQRLRRTGDPLERQRLSQNIATALGRMGIPGPWAQALPGAGGPFSTTSPLGEERRLGRQVVNAAGPGVTPGEAPAEVAPWPQQLTPSVAPEVAGRYAGGTGPGLNFVPPPPPMRPPVQMAKPKIEAARAKRGGLTPEEVEGVVLEGMQEATQSKLAGVRLVPDMTPREINGLVNDIVRHAFDEATTRSDKADLPREVTARSLIDSLQSYIGYRGPGTSERQGVDTRAALGELVIGHDRERRPVRLRDLVLGVAESVAGGDVLNRVRTTEGKMATQSLDVRQGMSEGGQASKRMMREASKREVEQIAALTKGSEGDILRLRGSYAKADIEARTQFLDRARDFVGALGRALAPQADARGVQHVLGRLEQAQDELSRIRDQMDADKVGNIGGVMRGILATTRQIAPQTGETLAKALKNRRSQLAWVGREMERTLDRAIDEIRGTEIPPQTLPKPTGRTAAMSSEVEEEVGSDVRSRAAKRRDLPRALKRWEKAKEQEAQEQQKPPAVLEKPDLPQPRTEILAEQKAAAAAGKKKPPEAPPPEPPAPPPPSPPAPAGGESVGEIMKRRRAQAAAKPKREAGAAPTTGEQLKQKVATDRQNRKTGDVMEELTKVTEEERDALVASVQAGDDALTLQQLRDTEVVNDPQAALDILKRVVNAQTEPAAGPEGEPAEQQTRQPLQGAEAVPGETRPPKTRRTRPAGPEVQPAGTERAADRGSGEDQRTRQGRPEADAVLPDREGAGRGVTPKTRPGILKQDRTLLPEVPDVASATWGVQKDVNGNPLLDATGIEGLNRMLAAFAAKRAKFALTDGMGVGKTRQAVAIAVEVKRRTGKPSLIVGPKAVVETFNRTMKEMQIPMGDRPRVHSYEDLSGEKIPKQQYGVVVFDEAHFLKNIRSQRSQAAAKVTAQFDVRASGTLFDNAAAGAYTIATLEDLPIEFVANQLGFRLVFKKNGDPRPELLPGNTWSKVNRRLAERRDRLIAAGGGVRRFFPYFGTIREGAKDGVGITDPKFLAMERALYDYWTDAALDARARGDGQSFLAAMGARTTETRGLSELGKIPEATRLAEEALARGERVILVAESVEDMNFKGAGIGSQPGTMAQLAAWAKSKKIRFAKIYGTGDKTAEIAKFQKGEVRLALMTPKSGGTGVDLDDQVGDATRRMIVLTRPWAGDAFEQLLGRVSRRNTKSPAQVDILEHVGGLADAHTNSVLKKKVAMVRAAQEGIDPSQSKLEIAIEEGELASEKYATIRSQQSPANPEAAPIRSMAPADDATRRALQRSTLRQTTLAGMLEEVLPTLPEAYQTLAAHYLNGLVPTQIPITTQEMAARIFPRAKAENQGETYFTAERRPFMAAVNVAGPQPARTLLHEATHVVTYRAYETLNEQGHPLAKAFNTLFAQVQPLLKASDEHDIRNAGKDVHELIAEGITQPTVQSVLKQVRVSPYLSARLGGASVWKSGWQAFKDWIKVVTGAPRSTYNALDSLLEGSLVLMEHGRIINAADNIIPTATHLLDAAGIRSAQRTAASHAGLLEDTSGRAGVAERILSSGQAVRQGLRQAALATSSLDFIREWMGPKFTFTDEAGQRRSFLDEYQRLTADRSARISRTSDDKIPGVGTDGYLAHYKGKGLTAKGLFDTWSDMARQDRKSAVEFDRLLTLSTEHRLNLEQTLDKVLNTRARMFQRFKPDFEALPEAWRDLYPAVREYYANTQKLMRDGLLDRLKADVQAANPETDLSTVDFKDRKAVKASDLLTSGVKRTIREVHLAYAPIAYYAPLRRRGDFVVRGDIEFSGEAVFEASEAEAIKEIFPEARLVMENRPDGKVKLYIRATPPPDITDPTVTGRGPGGVGDPLIYYERFENRAEANQRMKFLRQRAAELNKKYAGKLKMEMREGVDRLKRDPSEPTLDPIITRGSQRELMTRIEQIAKTDAERANLRRLVQEVTAGMLPDTYVARSRIRRRYVAGAARDQLRALGEHITAFSHNLAHAEYDRKIEDVLGDVEKTLVDDTKFTKGAERENARLAMREIRLRESVQLSKGQVSPWVNAVTGTTYFYMLSSASYSMIQFLQPFTVGLPLLGAKYGTARSAGEMGRALRLFSPQLVAAGIGRTGKMIAGRAQANIFDFESILDNAMTKERDGTALTAMLHRLRDVGLLDLSFSREIYEGRTLPSEHRNERGLPQQMSHWGQKALDVSRMLPHAVEVSNRALVAVAAYRMEIARGASVETATRAAEDIVRKSQIDYSTANKPRALQSKLAGGILRVPLMFKQYALHMYGLFALNAMRAVSGETKEERRIAAKSLAGLLTTHAVVAGAAGIMLEPIKIMLYVIAHALGGDDEPPEDIDRTMHEGLRELFGETLGEAAYGGLPRLLGADISGRVGLQNLLLFNLLDDIDRGRSWYEIAGSLVTGPVGSIALKAIPSAFDAFGKGDTTKGVAMLMPKFAKDAIKSYQLGNEGLMDSRGNRIDQTLTMDVATLASQALGFRPTQIANLYEARDAIITQREFIENRTSALLEQYWRSRRDPDARADVMQDIREFNAANPRAKITGDRLQQSLRARTRRERETIMGVYLPARQRYLAEEADYLR